MAGKRLFGFLPVISVRTAFRNSELVRRYKRLVFRKALRHVTSQIREICRSPERGFVIAYNNISMPFVFLKYLTLFKGKFVHIRVPFFITDEKELASGITGMYASSQCRRPCNCCTLDFFEENISKIGAPRDLAVMREVRHLSRALNDNLILVTE